MSKESSNAPISHGTLHRRAQTPPVKSQLQAVLACSSSAIVASLCPHMLVGKLVPPPQRCQGD